MATSVKEIDPHLTRLTHEALKALGVEERPNLAPPPRAEMGYLGLACFPYAKALGRAPVAVAEALRDQLRALAQGDPLIEEIHTEGPFLNFRLSRAQMLRLFLEEIQRQPRALGGDLLGEPQKLLIEYSSPNTNKPQHLGHVRNNLLGDAVANILGHYGYQVVRFNLINDRGIHICKSMLAYKRFGQGVTPQSAHKKGDHLVGDFYVRFEVEFQKEYKAWQQTPEAQEVFARWQEGPAARKAIQGWQKERRQKSSPDPQPSQEDRWDLFVSTYKDSYFNGESALGGEAREMLRRWEDGEPETRALWRQLNDWVEAGFWQTYARMGVRFDQVDYESDTYLLGKDLVEQGLGSGVFVKADNGATVFPLERIGLSGEKAVLRPDGTSLYTTQDLGTAARRFAQHQPQKAVYVVGDEQNHHFQVLFGILGELDGALKGRCHHLSYGMVNLPNGRMKSREGTVVDADDLMDEVHKAAELTTREIYKDEPLSEEELHRRAEVIGLAALKYFLLDYTPQTTMTFDPEASLVLNGRTGVYALYSYARTAGILRKGEFTNEAPLPSQAALGTLTHEREAALIATLASFPQVLQRSVELYDPSKITEYVWKLGKETASFYEACPVLTAPEAELREARLWLVYAVNRSLAAALGLLGISPLERM